MTYGPIEYWSSWEGGEDSRQTLFLEPETLVRPPDLLALFLQNEGAIPPPSGILVRRSALASVGGFEASFSGIQQSNEDQALYAKIGLKYPVYVGREGFCRHREHAASWCAVMNKQGLLPAARAGFLSWLDDYLSREGISDPALRTILRREQARVSGPRRALRRARRGLRAVARRVLPRPVKQRLHAASDRLRGRIPIGGVRFGDLGRHEPLCRDFGWQRGGPIDRHYIEKFLEANRDDIRGRVLEIGDSSYTRRFGGEKVSAADALHVSPDVPTATIVGDLATGIGVPSDAFDCIILTQTLPFIYEVRAAVANAHRALKPGGVALATFPGISQISPNDMDRWGQFWSFTDASARRLFGDEFGAANVTVETHGSVLTATAFLQGVAASELTTE
jgi:hypothetical protein